MKYAAVTLLLASLCLVNAWAPPAATVFDAPVGTDAEKISAYQDKLTELHLLQQRGIETANALQAQMEELSRQHSTLSQPQQVNGFSFKETISMGDGVATDLSSGLAAPTADASASTNPKMKKLAAAMKAVKEDIMAKLREAKRESAWVNDVQRIVTEYNKKVRNVKKNLKKIRGDIKNLIQKKRQIRNAQIQAQLKDRLKDASGDLEMITGKITSINAQAKAFNKNKDAIANTIKKINLELTKLKGAPKVAAKKAPAKKAAPAPKK